MEQKQSRLYDFGFERKGPVVERVGFPVQSICICCGKIRWLNWTVDGRHVCDECVGEGKSLP